MSNELEELEELNPTTLAPGLHLFPGGILQWVKWEYDEETEKGAYVAYDVTERAMQFLWEPVQLIAGVTLDTVFHLLSHNTAPLRDVFRRDFSHEYYNHYLQVKDKATPYTGEYHPDGIEYLELYWMGYKYENGEVVGLGRPDFHGVGYELREDHPDSYKQKGQRVHWGIGFSKLEDLLNLPLKINPEAHVFNEDYSDSENYGKELMCFKMENPMLGQFIRGILWELSWHGAPDKKQEIAKELNEAVEGVKNGTIPTYPFSDLDKPDDSGTI